MLLFDVIVLFVIILCDCVSELFSQFEFKVKNDVIDSAHMSNVIVVAVISKQEWKKNEKY